MRPPLMMMTRSHTFSISGKMWLEISTALRSRKERINARMPKIWCGSSPIVGSSRMMTSGSDNSASAMPTRWRKPFESVPMSLRRALRARSQASITASTRARISLRGTFFNFARQRRYSMTRNSSGNGLFSGMKPRWRFASSGRVATGTPQRNAAPLSACVSPARMRIVVDLPAPFGPRNPTISPGRTLNETSATARCAPNVLFRRRTSIAGTALSESPLGIEKKGKIRNFSRFRRAFRARESA